LEEFKSGSKDPEENDLIQLLLKRQAELNALLEVTLAINKNSAASVLFEMLEVVLKVNLNVGKMRLVIKDEHQFSCVSRFGGTYESSKLLQQICKELEVTKTIISLSNHSDQILSEYDFFVPVYPNTDQYHHRGAGE
jgi:sigma-B regulation protein RsbU (phosphoserine phosphatase)